MKLKNCILNEKVLEDLTSTLENCFYRAPDRVVALKELGFSPRYDSTLVSASQDLFAQENFCIDIGTSKFYFSDMSGPDGYVNSFINIINQELNLWLFEFSILFESIHLNYGILPLKVPNTNPIENINDVKSLVNFINSYINISNEGFDFLGEMGLIINTCEDCSRKYIDLQSTRMYGTSIEYYNTIHQYTKPRAMSDMLKILIELNVGDLIIIHNDDDLILL